MNPGKPLKIAFTIGTLETGGAQRILTILANHWAERGYEIAIVTTNGSAQAFYPLDPSIRTMTVLPRSRKEIVDEIRCRPWQLWLILEYVAPYLARHAWSLRRQLKAISPDVVVSLIDRSNALTLLALLNSSYARVVTEVTDPTTAPLERIWRILRTLLYRTADQVVVQTKGAAAFFHGAVLHKLSILPSPAVMPDISAENDIHVRRPAIVALGRLSEEKRFCDLIDAFAMIARQHPDWSLFIVGEGPLRPELEDQVKTLGLADKILLPGLTRNAGGLLLQADIFALSSRFEGFPTVLCEAMALGRPVISTDCPSGPRAIIRDGIDGFLVPPLVPKALADGLDRLIRNPGERQRLGSAAVEVTKRFSPEVIYEKWEAILQSAVKARAS